MNWIKYYPGMEYTFGFHTEYLVRNIDPNFGWVGFAVCDQLGISSDGKLTGISGQGSDEYNNITHFIPTEDLEAEIGLNLKIVTPEEPRDEKWFGI